MIPKTNSILLDEMRKEEEQPSKTYYFNTEKNIICGYCDGIDAMKQTIYCILNTERFEHIIHSWNYGIEIKHLKDENTTFVIPELERCIKEALLQDARIFEINNFQFETNKNQVIAKFKVITNIGEIEVEKAVSI